MEKRFGFGKELGERDGTIGGQTSVGEEQSFQRGVDGECIA